MKNLVIGLALLATLAACSQAPRDGVTSVPGRGAISVRVEPNPIVAKHVSGNTYELPFDVVVRETGGRPVNVTSVSVTVFFTGGLSLGRESWDADRIRAMGHDPSLGAHAEQRFRFNVRREVPDERLFSGVTAELRVDATDDTGAATSATTSVTATR